jgi:hypothetical protein
MATAMAHGVPLLCISRAGAYPYRFGGAIVVNLVDHAC